MRLQKETSSTPFWRAKKLNAIGKRAFRGRKLVVPKDQIAIREIIFFYDLLQWLNYFKSPPLKVLVYEIVVITVFITAERKPVALQCITFCIIIFHIFTYRIYNKLTILRINDKE